MFRIAHISDTHMRRSLPGVAPSARRRCRVMDKVLPAVLARCVANGADMIVFTGDLVEMPVRHHELPFGYTPPSPNDYRQEAIADYRWIREQLEATGLPYIVLPGNHDCDASLAEVFADQPMMTRLLFHHIWYK